MTPTPRQEQLLGAIRANPDDDAPRLVYADWLLDQGDPRGEFIRLQCGADTAEHPRLKELLAAHEKTWAPVDDCESIVWRRGFIWRLTIKDTRCNEFLWRWKPDHGPEPEIRHLGDPVVFDSTRTRVAMIVSDGPTAYESGEGGGYDFSSSDWVAVLQVGPIIRRLACVPSVGVRSLAFSPDGSRLIITRADGSKEEMHAPPAPVT